MMHSEWQNARSQRDAGKDTTCATQNGRIEALRLRLSLVVNLLQYSGLLIKRGYNAGWRDV